MNARFRSALPLALGLGVMLTAARPARAQDASFAPTATPAAAVMAAPAVAAPAGPTMDAARVGVAHVETAAAAPARGTGLGKGGALMIVGGAGVLVGLIIGGGAGDAIAVGGAVVGLIGLYQYLQ